MILFLPQRYSKAYTKEHKGGFIHFPVALLVLFTPLARICNPCPCPVVILVSTLF